MPQMDTATNAHSSNFKIVKTSNPQPLGSNESLQPRFYAFLTIHFFIFYFAHTNSPTPPSTNAKQELANFKTHFAAKQPYHFLIFTRKPDKPRQNRPSSHFHKKKPVTVGVRFKRRGNNRQKPKFFISTLYVGTVGRFGV